MEPFIFAIFFANSFIACSEPPGRRVLLTRHEAPRDWTRSDIPAARALPSAVLKLTLALKQQNLQLLEQRYWDATNPLSVHYQDWMAVASINELVSPPRTAKETVKQWLLKGGVRDIVDYGDALVANASLFSIELLFQCEFYQFSHKDYAAILAIWGDASIPDSLASVIDFVSGLNNFPSTKSRVGRRNKRKVNLPGRRIRSASGIWDKDFYVVPQTVTNMYSITQNASAQNSSQVAVDWGNETFSETDLSNFGSNMLVSITPPIVISPHVNGSVVGSQPTMNIQYLEAIGVDAKTYFWRQPQTSWLYGFALDFMNTPNVPDIVSITNGYSETDQCTQNYGLTECNALGVNSSVYVARVNTEFMKIGLRGVSLLSASGDNGANGITDQSCADTFFHPQFPASSPFVTSVGATQIYDAVNNLPNPPPICSSSVLWWCASGGTEEAVTYSFASFSSGGGFSAYSPLPKFQQSAVSNFLQSSNGKETPVSYFNPSGRAYPDVAALAAQVLVWNGNSDQSVFGTSVSTSIVSGVFSLLNNYARKTTKKPLGPLNQLIYSMASTHPTAFTDITIGDNTCTENGCYDCYGFYCGPGWDPVTGLGSPVYSQMLNYLQKIFQNRTK